MCGAAPRDWLPIALFPDDCDLEPGHVCAAGIEVLRFPCRRKSGIWYNAIANANYFHQYQVYVTYGGFTSVTCTYQGTNNITWCP